MIRHIPVAAKREVLNLYRMHRRLRTPVEAMELVMNLAARSYADRMVNGDPRGTATEYLDLYRAARFYMFRETNGLYGRKWMHSIDPSAAVGPDVQDHLFRNRPAETTMIAIPAHRRTS